MASAGGGFEFDREGNLPGGSFSRLLLSDDVVEEEDGGCKNRASPPPSLGCNSPSPVFTVSSPSCTTLFSLDTPKMLCFGDYCEDDDEIDGSLITSQTVSSSPVSKSSSNASISSLPKTLNSSKKRNVSSEKQDSGTGDQIGQKKSRSVTGTNRSRSTTGHAKGKKREKLGERIAALQQLVSPYGKTDTASVLHETMGYIKFLQDQVKVLCSPYLQRLPPPTIYGEKYMKVLKSKGLCLVPVGGIADMATSNNGADFWSPVTMMSTSTTDTAVIGNASVSNG